MKNAWDFIQHLLWNWRAYLYQPVIFFRGLHIRRSHNIDDIPMGDYCYNSNKRCPFLDHNPYASDQSYGYCHYIKAGDWQWKGTFLLWDQCKECEENYGDGE